MSPLARFSSHAFEYDNNASVQAKTSKALVDKALRYVTPATAADIGCGTGMTSKFLQDRINNVKITCCDTSKEMLQETKEKLGKCRLINKTLPEDSGYDLILSNFALQWFSSPGETMKQAAEKLNPGGILAVCMPVKGTFEELQAAADQCGLTDCILKYHRESVLSESIQDYECVVSEVFELEDIFANTLIFFKRLHSIGATLEGQNLSSGKLRKLIKTHDKFFNNQIKVKYRIWTAIYRMGVK